MEIYHQLVALVLHVSGRPAQARPEAETIAGSHGARVVGEHEPSEGLWRIELAFDPSELGIYRNMTGTLVTS